MSSYACIVVYRLSVASKHTVITPDVTKSVRSQLEVMESFRPYLIVHAKELQLSRHLPEVLFGGVGVRLVAPTLLLRGFAETPGRAI